MSEFRHFLTSSGRAVSSNDPELLSRWSRTPTHYTEVRIVPADAIVIERSELPAVFVTDSGRILAGEHGARIGFADDPDHTAELYRALAAQDLAVAEYLTANPPVDPQVESLAGVLREASVRGDFDDYAKHLIATGRVQVTS